MASSEIVSATEFKAKCLEILDRVSSRQVERVIITKRGNVAAVLVPPDATAEQVKQLHGFLRGSVKIPADLDLTKAVSDQHFVAEEGELHG